jgi:phosphatidylinositol dimannoside acyltransferase
VTEPVVLAYKAGAGVARVVPAGTADRLARLGGVAAARVLGTRRAQVDRNLRRLDPTAPDSERARQVDRTFASYARYWAESFRLPSLSPAQVDARFSMQGYGHIVDARADGHGAIIALPHLGGWEWAAFWLTAVEHVPVTAVVEALEPQELFDWFADYRRELGMTVVGLGPDAAAACVRALRNREVLCLLSDRDIGGGGVEVEFFGERTTLPAGPATLALRTGAPILPTAIYFDGHGHRAVVEAPLDTSRRGNLRADVARITQALAVRLEALISAAPEQWHLMSPNWPSDRAETMAPASALP